MSSDWRKLIFGDFLGIQRGHDLPDQNRRPGNVPILGSFGVTGFHDTVKAKGPGVTIGRSGASFGVAAYTDKDYWPLNTALYVTDFKGNDPKFVFYFLKQFDFSAFNSGSAQPSLNRNNLYSISIGVPDTKEQKLISNFLSALDARIELLRETNRTLESIAQALFKSWFVDFDPVHAKQACRERSRTEGREPEGMDSDTAALFPDSFEESELGLVPSGWLVAPIGDIVEMVGGGTPNTKEAEYWEPGEFAWTTPKDLSGLQSPVLLKTERLLSAKGVSKVSSGLLPIGTLLLSSRAPIGYLALAQIPLAINQGYIAILPRSQLQPLYMYFWLKQNMDVIKSRSNGSTFMEISKKAFRPIPILVPPVDLLDNFLDVVNPIFIRLAENEKQAQTLATLRDTLLPRLISGQLRLPKAETLLEEIM